MQQRRRSSPVVLQLLGRWSDSQIVFPMPQRRDFFSGNSNISGEKSYSYVVLNQLLLCSTHTAAQHFPEAETSVYPGASDLEEQPPQLRPEFAPERREGGLINWNLQALPPLQEEDVDGDENEGRFRRQAGGEDQSRMEKLMKIKEQLGPDDSHANAYFYSPKFSKTWANHQAKHSKSFIAEINKSFAPGASAHFSHVWANTYNFRVTQNLTDKSDPDSDFFVAVVLPPYCQVSFNDLGTMQALGFDSVNQVDDPFTILKRNGNAKLPWALVNSSNKRKSFVSKRAISDKGLVLLRSAAKRARAALPATARNLTPEVVVGETDYESFVLSLEYTGNSRSPAPLTSVWNPNLETVMQSDDVAAKLTETKIFFTSLLEHVCNYYGFNNVFYSVEIEPSAKRLVFTHSGPDSAHSPKDQLSIEFLLGAKANEFFLSNASVTNPLIWNFGVQSPLPVLLETQPQPQPQPPPVIREEPPAEPAQPTQPTAVEAEPKKEKKEEEEEEEEETTLPVLTPLLDLEEEARKRGNELADLLTANALLEERDKKEAAQKLIDLTRDVEEKIGLIKAEAERSKLALQQLERDNRLRLQAEEDRKKAAVEAILQTTREQEASYQKALADSQKAWTRKQAELEKQLEEGAAQSEQFIAEWEAQQAAEKLKHLERVAQKKELLQKQMDLFGQKIRELQTKEADRLQQQQRELNEITRLEDLRQRTLQEELDRLQAVVVQAPPPAPVPQQPPEEAAEEEEEEEEELPEPAAPNENPVREEEEEVAAAVALPVGETKKRKVKFLVASAQTPLARTGPLGGAAKKLPKQFVVLLAEGLQNDYITDWGRCCIAGTGVGSSAMLVSKQKCYLDLSAVQQLTLTLLDGTHLNRIHCVDESIVKIELSVYV